MFQLRRGAAALALMLAAAPAFAQDDDLVWEGYTFETGASLAYGLPETDYVPISFYCSEEEPDLQFSYDFAPINATDGVDVIVTLQAGDIIVPIKTVGITYEEMGIFVLEGTTTLDTRLADLLTSEGSLEVFVEDGSEEYSLTGAREAARHILDACMA